MCNYSDYIFEQAYQKGYKKACILTYAESAVNVAKYRNSSIEEAMSLLGVPEDVYGIVKEKAEKILNTQ